MAKMTTAARKALPKKDFALPAKKDKGGKNKAGRGGYPIGSREQAGVAKAYAKTELEKGNLSEADYKKVVAKADKKQKRTGGIPRKAR